MTNEAAFNIFCASLAVYIGSILYIRLNGLRTFSKMTSYDFAMTIGVGSILGATATNTSGNAAYGLLAIGCLVVFQRIASHLRVFSAFENVISNDPVCLVWRGELLNENLKATRVTALDVYAKLREANALNLNTVQAVILETSGDIAVLHGEQELDPVILKGVKGIPKE
jgi:uncharacterized membrane protein YcaP (DUF421 family)